MNRLAILVLALSAGAYAATPQETIDRVKKINGGVGNKLAQAYSDLQKKDVISGLYKAEDYCSGANNPELREGCKLLKDKIKEIGAEKIPPYQIAQDYEKFQANQNPTSVRQYSIAKQQLGQMRSAYGQFEIFDQLESDLDTKLPALKATEAQAKKDQDATKAKELAAARAEQQKLAAAKLADEAQRNKAAAAVEAQNQKRMQRGKEQEARESTPQCKAARKKDEYCSVLLRAERFQIVIDEQKEITASSGVVNMRAMNDLASSKHMATKESAFIANEYVETTGLKLTPSDCKVIRKPGKLRDQAFLDDSVAKSLENAIAQSCGAKN